MYTAIMKTENGRVAKLKDGFVDAAKAQAHVDIFINSHPNAFVTLTPDAPVHWWLVDQNNNVSISGPIKSTGPNDYTHNRLDFMKLLTDSQETEIKNLIQAIPSAATKREIRLWWEHTAIFRWDDLTMIKLLAKVTPATATAIEAAWLT